MNDRNAQAAGCLCNDSRAVTVGRKGLFGLRLRAVDGRIGRRVDHDIRGEFAERFLDLVRPQNVDVRASAESQHDVRLTGRCFPKGASNLSVRPEHI